MVALVRTEWSGTSGGPGLSQMAILGAAGGIWNPDGTQGAVNAVRTFWDSLKSYLPDELRLTVSPVVDDYDEITGQLRASFVAGAAPNVVAGTSATGYAGGAGLKVTWNTGQIRNGRRVRGSTFIVPIANTVFTSNGTIGTAQMTSINTAAATMLAQLTAAGTSMAVWSRPVTSPVPRGGSVHEVLTGSCSSKTAILRGRRD